MINPRHRLAIPVAIVLALALTPALSGCVGNPIQTIVKDATGGKVDVGGNTVPADFPTSIPLYKGKVDLANSIGDSTGKVWNITIEVPSADVLGGIQSSLEKAGFMTQTATQLGADGATIVMTGSKYGVVVVIVHDKSKGTTIANYTVTTNK